MAGSGRRGTAKHTKGPKPSRVAHGTPGRRGKAGMPMGFQPCGGRTWNGREEATRSMGRNDAPNRVKTTDAPGSTRMRRFRCSRGRSPRTIQEDIRPKALRTRSGGGRPLNSRKTRKRLSNQELTPRNTNARASDSLRGVATTNGHEITRMRNRRCSRGRGCIGSCEKRCRDGRATPWLRGWHARC